MKILYVTTIGCTMNFFKNLINELIDAGHTVDIATNTTDSPVDECYSEWGCKIYPISCTRSPLNKSTLKAVKEIEQIVSQNHYDIVHCHTPIAAMCTRLACKKFRKNGGKVFYTAHGFHFYKGAPFKNWLLYYPIEKICSYFTDTLITINKEDFNFAKNHLNAKSTQYVAGVGIDVKRFSDVQISKAEKRKELGIPENAILLASVGELNKNKNHQVILRAMAQLKNNNLYYIIAGKGKNADNLLSLAKKLGLENNFNLLGERTDIPEIYKASDICCFPSIREGLPVAVMEAMAAGLPIVSGDNRGSRDLCENGINGFLCSPFDAQEFTKAIHTITNDMELFENISNNNSLIAQKFDYSIINKSMLDFYGINSMLVSKK
ncbi:MAG: glycosyltransferase family 4 protein [Clostridia bacterium]|nr:glycosyltransferase family 4 protein [Clostridia bacterium]